MSIRVTVTSAAATRLKMRLTRAANFLGGQGVQRIMDEAAKDLVSAYQKQLLSFTPGAVPDLSDGYKEVKQKKHGLIYPILYATGGLFESMRMRAALKDAGWVFKLSFIGSNGGTPYDTIGNAHIEGTSRLPKRDFTKIPATWRKSLMATMRREVFSRLRG